MARIFGSASKMPTPNRAVLSWLDLLPDDFRVFIDLEGSDFRADFLVIKPNGIFNIEAISLPVLETRVNADWVLETREARPDPFLRLLDQCDKIRDYLLMQRDEIFSAGKGQASAVWDHRDQFKVFPVIALSRPSASLSVARHVWRRVYADSARFRRHLSEFEWFPKTARQFSLDNDAINKLAELWHLTPLHPRSLVPISQQFAMAQAPRRVLPETQNPYQYTYTVTGDRFYGRNDELLKIKRALESVPPRPIIITGLQRTGKSSLANESIMRYTSTFGQYTDFRFDFRLFPERQNPTEDLALEFLASIARDSATSSGTEVVKEYSSALKGKTGDQRRLLREGLRKNRERGRHNILFLDECQEIQKYLTSENHRSFFGFIDTLCRDADIGLHAVFVCRPQFLELEPIVELNLGRLCETITLGPLNTTAAALLVSQGEPPLRFKPEAKSRVILLAGGHPFWVQFLCHSIFERAACAGRFDVDTSLVDECFSAIVADRGCRPQFYILFQDIQRDTLAYSLLQDLADLADHEMEVINLEHLGERWRDRQLLGKGLRPLLDNQIIRLENSSGLHRVRFCVEALRVWMRENTYTLPEHVFGTK